ncbi:MAG: DUF2339 domain-containing protein, partial [Candidatus Altiarchaeota archaeon]
GFGLKEKGLRQYGLLIMILAICKVFLFDLAWLETLYRIVSFMLLGVILLVTSLAYSKFSSMVVEEKR